MPFSLPSVRRRLKKRNSRSKQIEQFVSGIVLVSIVEGRYLEVKEAPASIEALDSWVNNVGIIDAWTWTVPLAHVVGELHRLRHLSYDLRLGPREGRQAILSLGWPNADEDRDDSAHARRHPGSPLVHSTPGIIVSGRTTTRASRQ